MGVFMGVGHFRQNHIGSNTVSELNDSGVVMEGWLCKSNDCMKSSDEDTVLLKVNPWFTEAT